MNLDRAGMYTTEKTVGSLIEPTIIKLTGFILAPFVIFLQLPLAQS